MGLLCLPDEVLDLALKYLLPPFRSQSLAETYFFTIPVDLLVVRLVSRRLHRIATPLAWRRAQLQIANPIATNYGNYGDSTPFAAPTRLRSLVRCHFFQKHPELAAHVRVLLVSLDRQAECGDLARDALRVAMKAMTSLRTVFVWGADMLAIKDIRQFLQKPLLRAICFMDVDGSAFPAQCELGVKMLHIVNSTCPARLVASAGAALECVSIELARPELARPGSAAAQPVITLREMPWKTLREVSLLDCVKEADWCYFLDGFKVSLVFTARLRAMDGSRIEAIGA
jgi:hypothetical protein